MNEIKNVTIIVGAGAVQNAWNPIIKALKYITKREFTADSANFYLARYVYLLKFYSFDGYKGNKSKIREIKDFINLMKEEICNEIRISHKESEIKPQKEFNEIVEKFLINEKFKSFLISTNWDNVIDVEINKKYKHEIDNKVKDIECFHIHGNVKYPKTMYLPSEIISEKYRHKNEISYHNNNHISIINLLRKTHKLILYGLSLDPLDAELSQTLAASIAHEKLEVIIIINPEHEKIYRRVELLIEAKFSPKIIGIHPENLELEVVY